MSKFVVPLAVVVVIVVAVIALYASQNQDKSASTTMPGEQTSVTQMPSSENTAEYTDGTYSAIGNYVSPGGPREIEVSVTLSNGVITESTFVGGADDPTSERFQGEFAENYKPMVVGKNIDEVALTKVSGSSLTPKGFTDALEKIKTDAQS